MIKILKPIIPAINVPEFEGLIAYKRDGKNYFIKKSRYTGNPLIDSLVAIPLIRRMDIAFRQNEPIPKYLDKYLTEDA